MPEERKVRSKQLESVRSQEHLLFVVHLRFPPQVTSFHQPKKQKGHGPPTPTAPGHAE